MTGTFLSPQLNQFTLDIAITPNFPDMKGNSMEVILIGAGVILLALVSFFILRSIKKKNDIDK